MDARLRRKFPVFAWGRTTKPAARAPRHATSTSAARLLRRSGRQGGGARRPGRQGRGRRGPGRPAQGMERCDARTHGMTHKEEAAYRQQGFGADMDLGGAPALLIVDFINGFADPARVRRRQYRSRHRRHHSPARARARTEAGRSRTSRIVFADDDGGLANVFTHKVPGMLTLKERDPASAIVDALAPRRGELIVRKTAAVGLLRHGPGALAGPARRAHAGGRRLHHQRLRARQRGRRHVAWLQAGGGQRLRGRSGDRAARRRTCSTCARNTRPS